MNGMRTKEKITEDIKELVRSKGYIYALCMILIEDFSFNVEEIHKTNIHARLNLNEAACLVRLLIQDEVNFSAPDKLQDLMELKQKTYELMREFHYAFIDFEKLLKTMANNPSENGMKQIFSKPEVVAESIFYSGTGVYDIQYLELLEEKYKYDKVWLLEKRSFDAEVAKKIVFKINETLQSKRAHQVNFLGLKEKTPKMIEEIKKEHPDDWEKYVEMIPAMELYQYGNLLKNALGNKKEFEREELGSFCKSLIELFVIRKSDFDSDSGINSFLKNFSVDLEECRKKKLKKIEGFNCLTVQPIVPLDEEKYFIPLSFLVFEAVHKSPFHWMLQDKLYKGRAGDNRGKASEEIVYKILLEVFGESRTFKSVKIKKGKTIKTDIDVLCVLGSKALCVQVKSKTLTALSKTGDVASLARDFEKAIQCAYEQGLTSRREIFGGESKFYDGDGKEMILPEGIKEVYIMGVAMDYPTLAHQVKFLLTKKNDDPDPVFLTVFDLELVAHYLKDPYDFLYYVRQRVSLVNYFDGADEVVYLGYHLTNKLWKHPGADKCQLNADYGQLIDRNYYPQKLGLEISDVGDAIKNRWMNEEFNDLCNRLKTLDDPRITDIIFHLLEMSGETIQTLVDQIANTKQKTLQDGKWHNFSIRPSDGAGGLHFGITYVSLNSDDMGELGKKLLGLSQVRKYIDKCDVWIGFGSVKSSDAIIDSVVYSDQKWEFDQELEDQVRRELPKQGTAIRLKKIGRNEPCVCGSSLKYKKCCGA